MYIEAGETGEEGKKTVSLACLRIGLGFFCSYFELQLFKVEV